MTWISLPEAKGFAAGAQLYRLVSKRHLGSNWLRVLPIERTACSSGTKLLHARAVQPEHPSQKTLRSPAFCVRLCTGDLCIFLTIPLSYAAVAFSCGQYEKLLAAENSQPVNSFSVVGPSADGLA